MAETIVDLDKQIKECTKGMPDENYALGRSLVQPFRPANSGSRCLMHSVHLEQHMVLTKGEVPIISTGHENEFGHESSSYEEAEANYRVLYKIPKFSFVNNHYYLIVQNLDTGEYDYFERKDWHHNTESYGYLYNNSKLDSLKPGDVINKGDNIKKSNGFDDYGNMMTGTNLITMYVACDQTEEDSIIISDEARKKLESNLVKNNKFPINENDVLLNLYGDENYHKSFPDIGEEVKGGIFCSIRRRENDNELSTLSQKNMRDIFLTDKNILMDGKVVDIDVYCNNPEALKESCYNQQLYFYYTEKMNFCNAIYQTVAPLAMNGRLAYKLQVLFSTCRDIIGGKQFFHEHQFNNVLMEVTILEPLSMNPGDKMSDRYGGKGVVSKVVPKEMMPRLDNGLYVEVIKNQSTCINRENLGQLHEQSLTFAGMRIIDYFRTGALTYPEMAEMWYEFVSLFDQNQADWILQSYDLLDEWESKIFIDSILEEDDAIFLCLNPFTTNVDIDTIALIYDKFPWIKPYTVTVPMVDSNGEIRYIPTRRKLVVGKIYNYRLKQYAEEKFSVTSLCATNMKNLNTRSKANKVYEAKYTKTPIMFGAMETCNLAHLGMQYVIMNLMLYSSSPQGRRLFEQLLIGDPYNIDIKLDKDSKNRNAEIIHVLLKAMGLRLVFKKIPKKKKFLVKRVMVKTVPNQGFEYKTNIRDIIGHDDEIRLKCITAMHDKKSPKMVKRIMARVVKKDDN